MNLKILIMETKTFQVGDMLCKNCRIHIERAIKNIAGIQNVIVDINNGQVRVEGNEVDNKKVQEAVENEGYTYHGELTNIPHVSDQWIG
jgi:copper chaperone CopZ